MEYLKVGGIRKWLGIVLVPFALVNVAPAFASATGFADTGTSGLSTAPGDADSLSIGPAADRGTVAPGTSADADTVATPGMTADPAARGPRLPSPRVTAAAGASDTSGVMTPELPDTVRVPLRQVRRRAVQPKRHSIWWTTVRSGILPGWGQLANGKPVKAVLLAGIYSGLAVSAYKFEQDRKDLKSALAGGDDPALVARLNTAVDRRNARMWFMGATALYAMLDAYVDAHFVGYDETWSAAIRPDSREFAVTVKF